MKETVDEINNLASQIAVLNGQITSAKSGGDTASSLLDKRDSLLKQLSQLVDTNVVEQETGQVTVYIDSDPLIHGTDARKLRSLSSQMGI